MKVLFLPDYTRGNPHQRQLADALKELGVEVIIARPKGLLPIIRAVWVHGMPNVVHLHWTDHMLLARTVPKSILRSLLFIGQVLALKAVGVRVAWTIHNLQSHDHIHDAIEYLANFLLIRLYDGVIVYCEAARRLAALKFKLKNRELRKIVTTHLGHYIDRYPNGVSKLEARRSVDLSQDDRVLLYFGLIRPYKGVIDLIETFRRLDDTNVRLCIVGRVVSEELRHEIERRAANDGRVKLTLTEIEDDKVQIYMNAADIVVLPFKDVLNSSSVLLAMSFGKAVVAPRVGCIGEILDSDGSVLYDPDWEAGLLNSLRLALASDFDIMGRHNLAVARQYSWEQVAVKTYKVYSRG